MTEHIIRQQGAALQKGAATEDRQEKKTAQAFYQSEEGKRLFEEWKEKRR